MSLTIERLIQLEGQQQAEDQVSISNSIGSLRFLDATDWREFVETMSVVEDTLRDDPAGVYSQMDFATRDRYRHVVERTARRGGLSEREVAQKAVDLAAAAQTQAGAQDRTAHVGYYLIDRGVPLFERAAQVRLSPFERLRRAAGRMPLLLYLGSIWLIAATVTLGVLVQAVAFGAGGWGLLPLGALVLLCASSLGVAVVNWLATLLVRPDTLPRLDFSQGIPSDLRTLVVVPTLLTDPEGIEDLLEALEVRFLANHDSNLHFGLLTDFRDAPAEVMPEDEELLRLAREGIEALNRKYQDDRDDAFFLFHRPRRWNPQERVWMGYERKRGKLSDLNALLRGAEDGRFSLIVGERSVLPTVKYVITLDTDTQLPRDAARLLVGTLSHPLNRPRYDEAKGRICEGYGILQPRLSATMANVSRSWFGRLFGGEPGIDPYTRAVSDVYQDVFREGSFTGKGIYDVDAFERALGGRFPENLILSHDLLEGCYARAALVTDVQLHESYPTRFSADVSRRHRWIRGDWQIARWLLPRAPDASGRPVRNPISALSRWKILDNLRRSLVPGALVLLLLLGWTILSPAWFWTCVVAGILLLSPLLTSLVEIAAQADGPAAPLAPQDGRRVGRQADGPERVRPGAPALRGGLQPGRRAQDVVADARHAAPAPRVDDVKRRQAERQQAARRVLPNDVGSAGRRSRSDRLPLAGATDGAPARRAAPRRLDRLAGRCLVGEPADRAAGAQPLARADGLPAQAGPQDVALLRDVRRPRRQLAAARQLSGGARSR